MAENAVVLLSDSALTHDPEGQGEPFDRYVTEIAILGPDGTACLIERSDVTGADWLRRTRGLPAYGLILVAGVTDAEPLADHIDRALATAAASSVYAVAAALPERGVVVVRFLCATGADLTRMQDVIWHATREALTGHAPARRRK